MEKKKQSTSALIRSFLFWFLTFYLLFWLYQSWVNKPQETNQVQPNDIEITTNRSELVLGQPLLVTLTNNMNVVWDYADLCADGRRLVLERVLNTNQAVALDYSEADCQENISQDQRITIPGGTSQTLSLGRLNQQLFTEAGNYQVRLPESVLTETSQTVVQADLTYKKPGFIRKTFRGLITQPLFNLLVFLVDKIPSHSLGWAIVAMTVLVRMVLIMPNQKAMRSQRKLQKLQPEIESLKKKHGKNQQAMAMATMALYKKHKINPMSSCLPILLQMPFLLGIYFVVREGIRPHLEYLLYGFQKTVDLSVVDSSFFGLNLEIPNVLVLPIIVGLAQFVAMKLAMPNLSKATDNKPVKPAKSGGPDMAAQMQQVQKTMVWVMPIMIAVFTATFPAGVGIYWLTSTIFGIAQQKFVNWQLDQPQVKRKA